MAVKNPPGIEKWSIILPFLQWKKALLPKENVTAAPLGMFLGESQLLMVCRSND